MISEIQIPKISVIMPAFNAEKYIVEAVQSVLSQSFRDFEFLIIDDGSTDATYELVQSFASDARVRILKNNKNIGLISTLNYALSQCSGQYVARMDSDDICDPSRFQKQIDFLEGNSDIDLVGGAIKFFGNVSPNIFHFPETHEAIKPAMLFYCPLAHPALMFRRTLFEEGVFLYNDEFRHAEDYYLWSRLLLKKRVANIPDLVLSYRLHPSQVSSSASNRQYQASKRVRTLILSEAGAAPSEEELQLHESVILETPLDGDNYLNELSDWFSKIENSNNISNYWDKKELNTLLKNKYTANFIRLDIDISTIKNHGKISKYICSDFIMNNKKFSWKRKILNKLKLLIKK